MKVKIEQPLIKAVRGSSARYRHYLEEARKENNEIRKRKLEQESVREQIQILTTKKQKVERQSETELFDIDRQISDLQKRLL